MRASKQMDEDVMELVNAARQFVKFEREMRLWRERGEIATEAFIKSLENRSERLLDALAVATHKVAERSRGADNRNVSDMGRKMIAAPGDGYDVYSWSPGKAGEGVAPTQVHLVLPMAEDVSVILRLKSARALDELVAVLLQHRKDVWP